MKVQKILWGLVLVFIYSFLCTFTLPSYVFTTDWSILVQVLGTLVIMYGLFEDNVKNIFIRS